jgi:hypothetical protein
LWHSRLGESFLLVIVEGPNFEFIAKFSTNTCLLL